MSVRDPGSLSRANGAKSVDGHVLTGWESNEEESGHLSQWPRLSPLHHQPSDEKEEESYLEADRERALGVGQRVK